MNEVSGTAGSAPKRVIVAVAAFYLVAVGVSFIAAQFPATDYIGQFRVDGGLLIGLGPLLGAAVGAILLRQRFPSLFGRTFLIGALALLVPVGLTAITGFGTMASPGVPGLIFAASIIVYCICEEAGWRGFLTTNLAWMKDWHADLLSGVLWFAWHFTFMRELYDPAYLATFVPAIIAGAFGLAATRRMTGGFALASGWHAAIKLLPIGPAAFGLMAFLALLTWWGKQASARRSTLAGAHS